MSEKKPFVPKGVYLIVVNRGDMQTIFPLKDKDLRELRAFEFAKGVVMQLIQLQRGSIRKPLHPINEKSNTQLALQYKDTGEYLRAEISLVSQFQGKWKHEEVPELFRNEYTGRAPFVELNLVDSPIILVR